MQQMTIAALLVTFPALVVIAGALIADSAWLLPAAAAFLFTALPFVLAIIWLRNQKHRSTRDDDAAH